MQKTARNGADGAARHRGISPPGASNVCWKRPALLRRAVDPQDSAGRLAQIRSRDRPQRGQVLSIAEAAGALVDIISNVSARVAMSVLIQRAVLEQQDGAAFRTVEFHDADKFVGREVDEILTVVA